MTVPKKINNIYKIFSIVLLLIIVSFLTYKHFFLNLPFSPELIASYLTIIFYVFISIAFIWIVDLIASSLLFNPK